MERSTAFCSKCIQFFARVPQQFLPGQLYAMAAAVGSIAYVLFYSWGRGGPAGLLACIAVTFAIRMAAVKFNITSSWRYLTAIGDPSADRR